MSLYKRRRYDAASRWAESSGNKCSAKLGLKYVIAFLLAILLGSGQVMAKNAGWSHFRVVRNRTRWYFIPLPLNIVVLYFTSQIMFQPNFNTLPFTHLSRIFRRYSSSLFETVLRMVESKVTDLDTGVVRNRGTRCYLTPSSRRAASDIYAPPIRINYATRNRKYRLKDIGARYYDANERLQPLESAWRTDSRASRWRATITRPVDSFRCEYPFQNRIVPLKLPQRLFLSYRSIAQIVASFSIFSSMWNFSYILRREEFFPQKFTFGTNEIV